MRHGQKTLHAPSASSVQERSRILEQLEDQSSGSWEATEFDEDENTFFVPAWLKNELAYELFACDDLDLWEGAIISNIAVGLAPQIKRRDDLAVLVRLFSPRSYEGICAKRHMEEAVQRYAVWLKKAFVQELNQQRRAGQLQSLCVLCQKSPRLAESDVCAACQKEHWREQQRLKLHLFHAKRAGVPATLTLGEWIATIHYYHSLCAYCQTHPYEVLEHYIPLPKGGTTKENCVPACKSCNVKKQNIHPELLVK